MARRGRIVRLGWGLLAVACLAVLAGVPARSAVLPETLTFVAEADTFVDVDRPDRNNGASTTMTTDASPEKHALVRFTVAGLGATPVTRAVVRIYCTNSSPDGGRLYPLLDDGWGERTVTWRTEPARATDSVGAAGSVKSSSWVEIDVTGVISRDGTYSFALVTSSSDSAGYRTKEADTGFAPTLVLTVPGVNDETPPEVQLTSPAPGAEVSGIVGLSATATDDTGVTSVDYLLDGRVLGSSNAPPFAIGWDSRTTTNGEHAIVARAHDGGNNIGTSEPVVVRVQNDAAAFSFAAAGDHGANPYADASLASLDRSGVSFYLALGDLDYDHTATDEAWCEYVTSRLPTLGPSFPFELVSGNHEQQNGSDGYILNHAACLPDRMPSTGRYAAEYFFDYPASAPLMRVIMISPNLTIENDAHTYKVGTGHYAWLASAIRGARSAGIPWVTVGMHQNCISMGTKSCSISADLFNLLVNERVDLVLQGHDHNYQRSKQFRTGPSCPAIVAQTFNPACVADDGADGVYQKDEGPILVIAGDFGRGHYALSASDPEAPYFAAGDATTWGYVTYQVSADRIDARYVNTTGSFTDAFSIVGGPPPPPDLSAPSVPLNLAAVASPAGVDLSWDASEDDIGVTQYDVYRDGHLIGSSTSTAYHDGTVAPSTIYRYEVEARDAAGRRSGLSTPTEVTTLDAPPTTTVPTTTVPTTPATSTFLADADATIRLAEPARNLGTAAKVEVDGSPTQHVMLRFTVSGLGGSSVQRAVLRLYCVDSSDVGGSVFRTVDVPWTENGVTWGSAPATDGPAVATIGRVSSGTWYEVDVTSLVRGEGTYSIRITSSSSNGADYNSKEAGVAFAPRLVLTTG